MRRPCRFFLHGECRIQVKRVAFTAQQFDNRGTTGTVVKRFANCCRSKLGVRTDESDVIADFHLAVDFFLLVGADVDAQITGNRAAFSYAALMYWFCPMTPGILSLPMWTTLPDRVRLSMPPSLSNSSVPSEPSDLTTSPISSMGIDHDAQIRFAGAFLERD